MDYTCEKGAKRNFEPWRSEGSEANQMETEEEMLDRLEAEEAAQGGAMEQLEAKVVDAKREMDIADALDEIRTRNARIQRAEGKGEVGVALEIAEEKREAVEAEKRRTEMEDAAEAKRAFARGIEVDEDDPAVTSKSARREESSIHDSKTSAEDAKRSATSDMPPPTFKKIVKKKKDFAAVLGIKKKPALV